MDSIESYIADQGQGDIQTINRQSHASEVQVASPSVTPSTGQASSVYRARVPGWKRPLDVACIVVALPILLPLSLLVALGIKLVSPGPALFKQERVGLLGKRFNIFKFRTMVVGADASVHREHLSQLLKSNVPMAKMDSKGDARLIPLAWMLRATGLDELPQLLNVLRGEMSLVGPRPCLTYEYDQYQPAEKERFAALPGLTGLWQVSGKNHTTFSQMVYLDILYTRQMSFSRDMAIIIRTIPALMTQTQEVHQRVHPAPDLPASVEVLSWRRKLRTWLF